MPHLFFHVREPGREALDNEGLDFATLDAARVDALAAARQIVSQQALAGYVDLRGRIDVQNEVGQPCLSVRFEDAVTLRCDMSTHGFAEAS